MNNPSNLNGPSSVSPVTGTIWKIEKNHRADDREKRKHDSGHGKNEDRKDKDIIEIRSQANKKISGTVGSEENQAEQKTDDEKKQNQNRIDLII